MRGKTIGVIAIAIMGFVGCGASLRAAPLAAHVPAGAAIYLGWGGNPQQWPGYQGTHTQALLLAGHRSADIDPYVAHLLIHLGEIQPKAAVIGRMIWGPLHALWNSQVAVYVGGWSPAHAGAPAGARVGLLARAPAGDKAILLQALEMVGQQLNAQMPAPAGHSAVVVGHIGSLVYFFIKPTPQMLALAEKAGVGSLGVSPAFKAGMQQVGPRGGAVAYVDTPRLLDLIDSQPFMRQPKAATILKHIEQTLQLDRAGAVCFAGGFFKRGFRYSAFVALKPPAAPAMTGVGLEAAMLNDIPAGATTVSYAPERSGKDLEDVRSLLAVLSPAASLEYSQALLGLNRSLGFHLQKDFLARLGSHYVAFTDPALGANGRLGMVVELRPPHPHKISREIPALVRAVNRQIQKQLASGQSVKLRLKSGSFRADGLLIHYVDSPYITPAWCVDGPRLLLACYPQTLVAAAAAMDGPHQSICVAPGFVRFEHQIGGIAGTSSLEYADLPKMVQYNYIDVLAAQRLAFGLLDIFTVRTAPMLIPPLPELEQQIDVGGGKSWVDATGWHWTSIEPFPAASVFSTSSWANAMTTVSFSQYSMLTAILLPSLAKAKELANRTVSSANERGILQAAIEYANVHHGHMPPNVAVLVAENYITPRALISPGSGTIQLHLSSLSPAQRKNPAVIAGALVGHLDYFYAGSGIQMSKVHNPENLAVIFDSAELRQKQGFNVGFMDGHVSWIAMAEVNSLLAAQNAYRKKHHLALLP